MANKLPLIIALLCLSVESVLCSSHQQMAQMDQMEGEEHFRSMKIGQMRGMDDNDAQMQASWAESSKLLRAEEKDKGAKSSKNETEKEQQKPEQQEQKKGVQQDDTETEEDSKEQRHKPKKCRESSECFADSECGARSKCEAASLDKKKKVGTCDCGVCGGFPLFLFCGFNSGALSIDKNIVPRECGGLKNACVENPLIAGSRSKKCDCEAGFKAAGFKNLKEGQKKVCNKQKCDGKKDSCFGMKCTSGKCRCHLADL